MRWNAVEVVVAVMVVTASCRGGCGDRAPGIDTMWAAASGDAATGLRANPPGGDPPPEIDDRRIPAPPVPGVALRVLTTAARRLAPCTGDDVSVELTTGGAIVDARRFDGECVDACTASEKRAGAASLRRAERRVRRGESSPSILDYNFTECQFRGYRHARTERIGGRDLALLVSRGPGPHDVEKDSYHLAFELCGELFVSVPFADPYAFNWRPQELTLRSSTSGGVLSVDAASARWRGVAYRVMLPSKCPGEPVEESLAAED